MLVYLLAVIILGAIHSEAICTVTKTEYGTANTVNASCTSTIPNMACTLVINPSSKPIISVSMTGILTDCTIAFQTGTSCSVGLKTDISLLLLCTLDFTPSNPVIWTVLNTATPIATITMANVFDFVLAATGGAITPAFNTNNMSTSVIQTVCPLVTIHANLGSCVGCYLALNGQVGTTLNLVVATTQSLSVVVGGTVNSTLSYKLAVEEGGIKTITSSPGSSTVKFNSKVATYQINTAYNQITFTSTGNASFVKAQINGMNSPSTISLTTGIPSNVTVIPSITAVTCSPTQSFLYTVSQVSVPDLSTFTTTSALSPSFSPSINSYTVDVLSSTFQFSLTFPNMPVVACSILYNGVATPCSTNNSVILTSLQSIVIVELYIAGDSPPIANNYTFIATKPPCNVTSFSPSNTFKDRLACVEEAPPGNASVATTCITNSSMSMVSLAYNTTDHCGSFLLQYSKKGTTAWKNCTTSMCPLDSGATSYRLIIEDALEPSFLNITNAVNVTVNMTGAAVTTESTISSPCTMFTVSLSSPFDFVVAIDGGLPSQSFVTANTDNLSFSIALTEQPEVVLFYNFTVDSVTLSFKTIRTNPGGSTLIFNTTQYYYDIVTAYSNITIVATVDFPSLSSAVIDGMKKNKLVIPLTNTATIINVTLIQSGYSCPVDIPLYQLAVTEVEPVLSNVTTTGILSPSFSNNNDNYTIVTTSPSTALNFIYNSSIFICTAVLQTGTTDCTDASLQNIAITATPQNVTVQLAVISDSPYINTTYTFYLSQQLCNLSSLVLLNSPSSNCTYASNTGACIMQIPTPSNVTLMASSSRYCSVAKLQYQQANGVFSDCLNMMCPLLPGLNHYQFVANNIINASSPAIISTLTISNVQDFVITVNDGYVNKEETTITSPCQTFNVTLSADSNYMLQINNGQASAVFTTATTKNFMYTIVDSRTPQVSLKYSVSVSAITLGIQQIMTSPGGNNIVYNALKTEYATLTAYSYIVVTVTPTNTSISSAIINGTKTNTANLTITSQQDISVSLASVDFSCTVLDKDYIISVTPVSLEIAPVQTDAVVNGLTLMSSFTSAEATFSAVSNVANCSLTVGGMPASCGQAVTLPLSTKALTIVVDLTCSFDTPPLLSTTTFVAEQFPCAISGFQPTLSDASNCVEDDCLLISNVTTNVVGFSFTPNNCPYSTMQWRPQNESVWTNTTWLSLSSSAEFGVNEYRLVFSSISNPTQLVEIQTVNVTLVDLYINVSQAEFEGQSVFDPLSLTSTLKVPCPTFDMTSMITTDQPFTVDINGDGPSATIPVSQLSFDVTVSKDAVSASVTYAFTVMPDPLRLNDLVISPAGGLNFQPTVTSYSIVTAWPNMTVLTSPDNNAVTSINGTIGLKYLANFTAGALNPIYIVLKSSVFLCDIQTYTLNVQQVELALSDLTVDASSTVLPAYSSKAFNYKVIGRMNTVQLFLGAPAPGIDCVVTYNGFTYQTCDINSKLFPVTQAPSDLTITLGVSTDSPALTVTYTITLRKIGCFVTDLVVGGVGGLSNCSIVEGVYPIPVGCVSSPISSIAMSFAPYESCSLQVLYSTDSLNWISCSGTYNQAEVQTNCNVINGINYLSIYATDPDIITFSGSVVNISLANVMWNLNVSHAVSNPLFSESQATYNLTAPCSEFELASDLLQAVYANCSVSINGGGGSAVVDAETTNVFDVRLCFNGCDNGVFIKYNFAVIQDLPWLSSLTSFPARVDSLFSPSTYEYDFVTEYSNITILAATTSTDHVVWINGGIRDQDFISLSPLNNTVLTVELYSEPLRCSSRTYTIQVTQVPIQLDELQSSADFDFTSEIREYHVQSNANKAAIFGSANQYLSCIVTIGGQAPSSPSSCSSFKGTVPVPGSASVIVYAPLDELGTPTEYNVSFTFVTQAQSSKSIILAASVGGVLVVALIVVAFAIVHLVKQRKAERNSINFFTSDSAPLYGSDPY